MKEIPMKTNAEIICSKNKKDLDDRAHPFVLIGTGPTGKLVYGCMECGAGKSD